MTDSLIETAAASLMDRPSRPLLPLLPRSVRPRAGTRIELLLTATTPISHYDPAVQDKSNQMLFNRRKQILALDRIELLPSQDEIDRLCAAHPAPADLCDLLADLSVPEFAATILVRIFLQIYNSRNAGEGEGIFTGPDRYGRLENRLRNAAIRARNVRSLWSRLCGDLQVGIHPMEYDAILHPLFGASRGLQSRIVSTLVRETRSIVPIARLWHSTERQEEKDAKAGPSLLGAERRTLSYPAMVEPEEESALILDVPALSSNSVRHQLVRAPAWTHLCGMLGLKEGKAGRGRVPAGVEAIFVNGGNIAAGAKAPDNPHRIAWDIRDGWPILDLLGGVTDTFDLGESRLQVAAWLVCKENTAGLKGSAAAARPAATLSALDMIDDITQTRQETEAGLGQMIMNFESIAAGAEILVRLSVSPFASQLSLGALAAAIGTFDREDPTIGGQAARGFGNCSVEWLTDETELDEAWTAYETYLNDNADLLVNQLETGTLGSSAIVFKA